MVSVVVAYGFDEHLQRCLKGVTDVCPVVVVDNSSRPEVAELARGLGASYVDPGRNLGFAGGVNVGLRHAPDDANVLLVNPDALVTREVAAALADTVGPGVAAVSPRLSGIDGVAQRVRWPFPSPRRAWRQALLGGDGGPVEPGFLVGAVLLLSKDALDEVGSFDERFFLYAEETDWQRRAVDAGWTTVVCDSVTAVHIGGATSSDPQRREALFHAGTETYVRKWFGTTGWQSYRAAVITSCLIRGLVRKSDRDASWRRLQLYARGPRRVAGVR